MDHYWPCDWTVGGWPSSEGNVGQELWLETMRGPISTAPIKRAQPIVPLYSASGASSQTVAYHRHVSVKKSGWCWLYRSYASGDVALKGLEKEAREGNNELWTDPQPVLPWEWRKLKHR
ncbi:MAG: hypothetical protein OEV71_06950 [Nitrospira sp.]|nr:hypothetical protein [Nitrospira sp.]